MAKVNILQNPSDGTLWADLPGGGLQQVTEEQARTIKEGRGGIENILRTGAEEFGRVAAGAASLLAPSEYDRQLAQEAYKRSSSEMEARSMVSPLSTMGGQALPAIGLAAATGGTSLPGMIGAEAVYGAAAMAENPLLGATLGAAGGALGAGAGAGIPMAARAAQQAVRGGVGDIGFPIMGAVPQGGGSMAGRVAAAIDGADVPPAGAAGQRVLYGTNTAEELEAMGARLAPYQRQALNATTPEEFRLAERMRWQSKLGGNDFAEELGTQRQAFTDLVKRELGIEGPENLTPRMVAEGLDREGKAIGSFRTAQGNVTLDQNALSTMRQVAEEAASTHQAALRNIVGDIENSIAKTGGEVAPVDINSAIRRLNTLSAPGSDPARITDAKQLLSQLEAAIESKLNPAERVAYQEARYRYKVLKALDRGAAVSADGTVNPVSFGRNWDKATAQTLRGSDTLGKAADTFASIQVIREHPGSTLQRVFANAPNVAKRAAPAALGSALGLPILGGLGGLF